MRSEERGQARLPDLELIQLDPWNFAEWLSR